MDDLPQIPDGHLEDDFDFLRTLTIVCSVALFGALGFYTWMIYTGEISLVGPSALVLEKDEDFDSLIGYKPVSDLTGSGVDVCIVDSGIDMTHRDLKNANLRAWSDLISGRDTPYDDNGHGTSMAGILVADGGLKGMAIDVNLYVAKALTGNGEGDDETVGNAIEWCITQDVNIISLSLGGAPSGLSVILGDDVEDAVDSAYDAGIVVVAAAGNDGEEDDGDVASPGIVSTVICVGGVDVNGNLWSGSSIGDNNGRLLPPMFPRSSPNEKPEVVAPGHKVPVIMTGGSWGLSSGTSAATVYVTGAVALMFENSPGLMDGGTDMLDDLKQWIVDSSLMRPGQEDHDDHYGYGLLQVDALISASQGDTT